MKTQACLAFLLLPLCQGCILEDLEPCRDEAALRIEYDWSAAPEANPEGMSALFFPASSGPYWRFETPPAGGTVDLGEGTWNVLCYNNDTSVLVFENQDDFDTALVTSRAARLTDGLSFNFSVPEPPRRASEARQPVITAPDPLWCASAQSFVKPAEAATLRVTPTPLTAVYSVTVYGVENTGSISRCGMAISGLSAGYHLKSLTPLPVEAIIPGSMTVSAHDTLSGHELTFGRAGHSSRSVLYVYVILRDARSLVYEYDVTSQIEEAPDPTHVKIKIKGPELPVVEDEEGSGMDIGVDEWETVNIELTT